VGGGRWRASSTTSSGGSWSDGQEERRDLIVLPDRVVRNWWRHDGHALALEDLDQVLDDLPEHLVIGTGAHGQLRLDQRTVQRLKAGGVTVRACRPAGPSAATASWSPLGRRPSCT
jgi:hypothetical protein